MCSGIDGFALAARAVGWENCFYCEIDGFCRQVLKYHYPDSVSYEDLTKTDFRAWKGKVDVLSAGFPCQPFSQMGSRQGANDDRYLWPEVYRVIGEVQPRWFCGENVAGLLSMVLPGPEINLGRSSDLFGTDYLQTKTCEQYILERICNDLETVGYEVQVFIIPAAAVGAPHRRDRVWIVAFRSESLQAPDKNLFVTHSDGERCKEFGNDRKRSQDSLKERLFTGENKQKRKKVDFNFSEVCSIITDGQGESTKQYGRGMDSETERLCTEQFAPNPYGLDDDNTGFYSGEIPLQNPSPLFGMLPDWRNFPTQSPLCRRDDGLSNRLHNISFQRWRAEAIKCFGNAVVPQVPYEIFRAIEAADSFFNL